MRYYPPTGSTDPNAAYIGKNPAIGQQGSKVPPRAIEHTMRELVAIIAGAGLTPDENNTSQVWQALQAMDPSTFRTVSGSPIVSPPASPANGDEYAVQSPASGDWSGKDGQIARWDANSAMWRFSQCRAGRVIKVADTDTFYRRTGAGWSGYTFGASVNPSVAWGGITGFLGNQSDLSNALAGKLALAPPGQAGQTVSGALGVRIGSNAYQALEPGSSASTSGFLATYSPSARIGYFGRWDGSVLVAAMSDGATPVVIGAGGTEAVRVLSNGNVGVGGSPSHRLHVNGDIGLTGALQLPSGAGVTNQVPVSHAGSPNTWANVIDLITTPELRAKLGGKTIIAIGTNIGAVTFAASEPDTAYSVAGLVLTFKAVSGESYLYIAGASAIALSGKTVNGCTVMSGAGAGDAGTVALWIIYR